MRRLDLSKERSVGTAVPDLSEVSLQPHLRGLAQRAGVVGVMLASLSFPSFSCSKSASSEIPPTGGTNSSLRYDGSSAEEASLGQPLPHIKMQGWFNSDQSFGLEDLRGEVVLIEVWGTFCAPCIRALPETNDLAVRYSSRGLVTVALNAESAQQTYQILAVRGLLGEKAGILFGMGARSLAHDLGVTEYPQWFVVDREGLVRFRCGVDQRGVLESELDRVLNSTAQSRPNAVPRLKPGAASGEARAVLEEEKALATVANSYSLGQWVEFEERLRSKFQQTKRSGASSRYYTAADLEECFKFYWRNLPQGEDGADTGNKTEIRRLSSAILLNLYLSGVLTPDEKQKVVGELERRLEGHDVHPEVRQILVRNAQSIFSKENGALDKGVQVLRSTLATEKDPNVYAQVERAVAFLDGTYGDPEKDPASPLKRMRDQWGQQAARGSLPDDLARLVEFQDLIRQTCRTGHNQAAFEKLFEAAATEKPLDTIFKLSVLLDYLVNMNQRGIRVDDDTSRYLQHALVRECLKYGGEDSELDYLLLRALDSIGVDWLGMPERDGVRAKILGAQASRTVGTKWMAREMELNFQLVPPRDLGS